MTTASANRFHVHLHVADLDANIRFYSGLFGAQPVVRKPDYAKWLLDDPHLNFAISTDKHGDIGIAHLGLQASDGEALQAIGQRLHQADAIAAAETATTCCYARSDKYWAEDPQGLRWETFHTFGDATTYYASADDAPADTCCGPQTPQGACCPPKPELTADAPCCA